VTTASRTVLVAKMLMHSEVTGEVIPVWENLGEHDRERLLVQGMKMNAALEATLNETVESLFQAIDILGLKETRRRWDESTRRGE
jgi:hypothetical protein